MGEIRTLSVKDVSICSDFVSVFIPKRKNDRYREGDTSLLARSHKATCPVSITERLLKILPSSTKSSSPLVRRIVKSKFKEYFHATKGVSYTTLREEFRKYVTARTVSSLAPLQILRVGIFLLICWTCTPAGNVLLMQNL